MAARKQNIVIVGGGASAVTVAQGLSQSIDPSRFNIQVVTERPYYIHYPAMLRVLVAPDWPLGDKAFVPIDRVFNAGKAGEMVIGKVTSVEDGAVHLEDGRVLAYDYLVLGTGTVWNGPLIFPADPEQRDVWIAEWRAKFAKSNDIVIVGGGACGIELAGELRHYYSADKRITIVHNDTLLLNPTYPDKFRKHAGDRVRAIGVNVVLGDRASMPTEPYTSVTTNKGQTIKADLVIPMWGANYNTGFLKSFDATILTAKQQVRIHPTLQVRLANGKGNVYALGDIIEWNGTTQLAKIPGQAEVVIANILAATKGNTPKVEYKGFMEGIAIPLGPKLGFGYLPLLGGITIGDWVTPMLKSKKLFVDAATKMLHY